MKGNQPYVSFNGGEIGKEIVARTQLQDYGATAEILENILPEAAGPMSLRPGSQFLVELGQDTRIKKFNFGVNQKYLLCFSDNIMRVVQNGGVIFRPAVSAAVSDPDFAVALGTAWTNVSDVTGYASTSGGQLLLNGDGPRRGAVKQQVSTASPNIEHVVEIDVAIGPVTLIVGSTSGASDLIKSTTLRKGFHSLAFTPAGSSFWIQLSNADPRQMAVNSCALAANNDMEIPTPWLVTDFTSLRFQQSNDVMWVTGAGAAKRRVERHGSSSWSLTYTDEQDGPFLPPNLDESITMTPSVFAGNGTLTASKAYFQPGHVGALFKLVQQGQRQQATVVAGNGDQWSDTIRIQGIGTDRNFTWSATGTFSGTLRIQRSFEDSDTFANATNNLTGGTTTTAGTVSVTEDVAGDINSNITYLYRVGCLGTELLSGSALVAILADSGSQSGICRITGYVSATVVNIEVLDQFSQTTATADWLEGAWSDVQGQPNAVALFDDRLWEGFADQYWASASGIYEQQGPTNPGTSGDADPIARSISTGDVGIIQWILPLSRVIVGTDVAEDVIRSDALDSPLTPSNLTVRDVSTWGSADCAPTKVDSRGLFVDRSQIHIMELVFSGETQDYVARPLTRLNKNIGRPGLTQVVLSRRPETRLMSPRADGQLLIKLYDPGENVLGWARFTTPLGQYLACESLPGSVGTGQDEDYFVIKRRIAGVYRYYLEQLGPIYYATMADASCLDAFVRIDQAAINAVTFARSSYLTRSDLDSLTDGQKGIVSFWVNFSAGDTDAETTALDQSEQTLYASANGGVVVRRTATGQWQLEAKNGAGTSILKMTSANSYGSATGWTHVLFAWDLSAGTPRGQFRIAQVTGATEIGVATIAVNDTIDYTQAAHAIGATTTGANPLSADVTELYMSFNTSLDLTVAANVAKFIASRNPVDLSANGTGPTGQQPVVLLNNDFNSFQLNVGAGGDFAFGSGFLIAAAAPPAAHLMSQTKIISGLDHLEGEIVRAWVDGVDLGDYTVSGGSITIAVQYAQAVVGLRYAGTYKSSRVAFMSQAGTAQTAQQQLKSLSLMPVRSSLNVLYGGDFVTMDNLKAYGLEITSDDEGGLMTGVSGQFTLPGGMSRDPRLCITMPGPDPVTLAGYVLTSDVVERAS